MKKKHMQVQCQGVEKQTGPYQLPGIGSRLVTDDLQKLLRLRVAEIRAAQGGDQRLKRQQQGHICSVPSDCGCRQMEQAC